VNFGQNLYNWFLSNAQSLVLMAIVVIGIYLGFKREFSKLIGFLIVALIAVGLVFNASGVKDVLLNLFNRIIGS
jgi:multisubunit Na+/H+ antiporter MnhC subunit